MVCFSGLVYVGGLLWFGCFLCDIWFGLVCWLFAGWSLRVRFSVGLFGFARCLWVLMFGCFLVVVVYLVWVLVIVVLICLRVLF